MAETLQSGPGTGTTEGPRERETVRARLLRANTAVAVVILTVLVLALAALWQMVRATRLEREARRAQGRAERAEAGARFELWRSLLAEARSTRQGQTLDRRASALATIRRAAELAPTAELRTEAVAALALPERRLESSLPLDASVSAQEFDDSLQVAAIGLTNGLVLVRRMADGQELARLDGVANGLPAAQGRPLVMAFSPDGKRLAVRHNHGALVVWDVEKAKVLFLRDADVVRRPASRALFSEDGRHLVAPVFEPDGFAVLDAGTGAVVAHFGEVSSFHHAAVRPGHSQFAAYDGVKVRLLDWKQRRMVLELPVAFGAFRLGWSPDGRQLAVFGNSLEIKVWDVEARRVRTLRGHQDAIYDGAFDPEGRRLSGLSQDGVTRIWNVEDGRVLDTAVDRRLIRWGRDGRTGWLVSRKSLDVWREGFGGTHRSVDATGTTQDPLLVDLSPDGKWLGMAGPSGLRLWSLESGGPFPPQDLPFSGLRSFCFDPGAPVLHLVRNGRLERVGYTVEKGVDGPGLRLGTSEVDRLELPELDRVACSVDGRFRLVTSLLLGRVYVLGRFGDGQVMALHQVVHSGMVFGAASVQGAGPVALSPDGAWAVCGADGPNGTCVYDARTGQRVRHLGEAMAGVHFSRDGSLLALSGVRECRLLRTKDWSEAWRVPTDSSVFQFHGGVAISPDGKYVAFVVSPRQVMLVDAATGGELARLESPTGSPVLALRWTPTEGRLVAAARDQTVSIWDPVSLQRELEGLSLGRVGPGPAVPAARLDGASEAVAGPAGWAAAGVLLTVGGVAGVSIGFLRRHRRLIEDYAETEARSLKREQELEIEREVSQLKSRFVAMVSHEFRTPLGITMSAVELLRHYFDRLPPGKRVELLDDIHGATRHMSGLMEQVLLLGRVEAGKLGMRPAPMNLLGLVEKLTDETLSATDRKCPVRMQVVGTVEGAVGDEGLVRHIVGNLVSNAVKYSPEGSEVRVEVVREGSLGVVRVVDQGIGIPQEEVPRLFQAFQRASNVGEIPGSGLGLVIVKRCVDLHQGTIRVESVVGQGTTFEVRLPLFGP